MHLQIDRSFSSLPQWHLSCHFYSRTASQPIQNERQLKIPQNLRGAAYHKNHNHFFKTYRLTLTAEIHCFNKDKYDYLDY